MALAGLTTNAHARRCAAAGVAAVIGVVVVASGVIIIVVVVEGACAHRDQSRLLVLTVLFLLFGFGVVV